MFQKSMVILPERLECFVGFLDRILSNSKLCFPFLDVEPAGKRFAGALIVRFINHNRCENLSRMDFRISFTFLVRFL